VSVVQVELGNKQGPTAIDINQMNLLYKCSGGGGGNRIQPVCLECTHLIREKITQHETH